MAMTGPAAASPDAYVAALDGWQRALVGQLRRDVLSAVTLDECIRWTNLVYLSNGPVCLIRAESERVLFGFWRGKRLRGVEPRLKPGGRFELANIVLREGDAVAPEVVARLAREAVALNGELGDPTKRSA